MSDQDMNTDWDVLLKNMENKARADLVVLERKLDTKVKIHSDPNYAGPVAIDPDRMFGPEGAWEVKKWMSEIDRLKVRIKHFEKGRLFVGQDEVSDAKWMEAHQKYMSALDGVGRVTWED